MESTIEYIGIISVKEKENNKQLSVTLKTVREFSSFSYQITTASKKLSTNSFEIAIKGLGIPAGLVQSTGAAQSVVDVEIENNSNQVTLAIKKASSSATFVITIKQDGIAIDTVDSIGTPFIQLQTA